MVKAFLKADEVKKLEKAATNLRDRLLIRLLSHLGCRISEALGIKIEDIAWIEEATRASEEEPIKLGFIEEALVA